MIPRCRRVSPAQYNNIHRLETNKLRNVAKMYSHLLVSDAINWTVLETIHLNEDETNASSRIFIKILFQVRGPPSSIDPTFMR
jgi:hypothetical protein